MHRRVDIAHGKAEKRKEIVKGDAEFVVINYDGVEIVADEVKAGGFDLVVVDEGNAYKNPQTRRWKVLSSILQQADAQLAEHELTYVQWLPLYKLLLCSDATNAGMARDLGLDPASITRALDRLESKGMLRRERSTVDRRVVKLVLTDEGRAMAAKVPQVLSISTNGGDARQTFRIGRAL
jgi:DNA-binding MarR family transcriptional regulator